MSVTITAVAKCALVEDGRERSRFYPMPRPWDIDFTALIKADALVTDDGGPQ